MNILVSACLLGVNCRYSGDGCEDERILRLAQKHVLIPVCPEQLGGLPTPRGPDELVCGKVLEKSGKDNTAAFERGAAETLRLALLLGCRYAVLKERSPSCGSSVIYDGTFSGRRIPGSGVTASLLMKNGIKTVSEETLDQLISELEES